LSAKPSQYSLKKTPQPYQYQRPTITLFYKISPVHTPMQNTPTRPKMVMLLSCVI